MPSGSPASNPKDGKRSRRAGRARTHPMWPRHRTRAETLSHRAWRLPVRLMVWPVTPFDEDVIHASPGKVCEQPCDPASRGAQVRVVTQARTQARTRDARLIRVEFPWVAVKNRGRLLPVID